MCNIHVTVWYRYMHRMTYVYDDIGQVCRISIIYLYSILQIRRQTSKKNSEAGTSYLSEAHEFTIAFIGAHFAQVAVLCVVFCRSLFVLLSFFFWPLYSMAGFIYRLDRLKPRASKFRGPPAKVYTVFNSVIAVSHLCCHNVLYFLNNPSVIFFTQLHFISEYCTPHHLRLHWNWLNMLPSSSSREGRELRGGLTSGIA
jgi:hypothetical protein